MNKEELKEQIKKLKVRYGDSYDSFTKSGSQAEAAIRDALDLIDQLDKPDKVVVPNYVAEWIEENKRKYSLRTAFGNANAQSRKTHEYIVLNVDTFARAWLDGYTVEEKKYLAKYNGEYIAGVTISEGEGEFKSVNININFSEKELSHLHTQKELDDLKRYIDIEAEEVSE